MLTLDTCGYSSGKIECLGLDGYVRDVLPALVVGTRAFGLVPYSLRRATRKVMRFPLPMQLKFRASCFHIRIVHVESTQCCCCSY